MDTDWERHLKKLDRHTKMAKRIVKVCVLLFLFLVVGLHWIVVPIIWPEPKPAIPTVYDSKDAETEDAFTFSVWIPDSVNGSDDCTVLTFPEKTDIIWLIE